MLWLFSSLKNASFVKRLYSFTTEVTLGTLLGRGEFGAVREVTEVSDKTGHHGLAQLLRKTTREDNDHSASLSKMSDSAVVAKGNDDSHQRRSIRQSTLSFPQREGEEDPDDSYYYPEPPVSSTEISHNEEREIREREGEIEFERAREARKVLKKRCWRDGKARYAAKQLRDDLIFKNGENYKTREESEAAFYKWTIGLMDLAMEAKLLASLSHPNICKLRGTAGVPGQPDYMLVLDRLYVTFDEKICEWYKGLPKANRLKELLSSARSAIRVTKKNSGRSSEANPSEGNLMDLSIQNQTSGFLKKKGKASKMKLLIQKGQLLHRLYAAYDVARALRYLHQHMIVYRDLKPQNIAFDVRGDVRVFDFGLAKELVDEDLVNLPDDYNATGLTGSRRWMPPEVYFSEVYGLSADVYSYGLLLWNLCYLETPFGNNLTLVGLHSRVMLKGDRPKRLHSKVIKNELWSLMTMCWSKDRSERPSFEIICEVLRKHIADLRLELQMSNSSSLKASSAPAPTALADKPGAFHGTVVSENVARQASANTLPMASGSSVHNVHEGPESTTSLVESVDMSCHGNALKKTSRGMRGFLAPKKKKKKWRLDQNRIKVRRSNIENRSEYLQAKSALSLANLQISSANLNSGATKGT